MHSFAPPGSSAHQPDPAAGAVHHERDGADRRRPVRAHLAADVEVVLVGTDRHVEQERVHRDLSTLSLNALSRCSRAVERALGAEAEARALGQPGLEVDVEPQPLAQARSALAERAEPAVRDDEAEAVDPADDLDAGLALLAQAHLEAEVADDEAGVVRRPEDEIGNAFRGCRGRSAASPRWSSPGLRARARLDRGVPRSGAAVVAEADAHARLEPRHEAGRRCAARGTRRRVLGCSHISKSVTVRPPDRSSLRADQQADRQLGIEAAAQIGEVGELQPVLVVLDRAQRERDRDPAGAVRAQAASTAGEASGASAAAAAARCRRSPAFSALIVFGRDDQQRGEQRRHPAGGVHVGRRRTARPRTSRRRARA